MGMFLCLEEPCCPLSCQPKPNVESREVRDAQGGVKLFQFRVLMWALLLLNRVLRRLLIVRFWTTFDRFWTTFLQLFFVLVFAFLRSGGGDATTAKC